MILKGLTTGARVNKGEIVVMTKERRKNRSRRMKDMNNRDR